MRNRLPANLMYNVFGSVLPLFATLITVPIYLKTIGADRYGILSIAWIVLGYLGFLDFGLSRAAANALAKASPPPSDERSSIIGTVLIINAGIGIIGALLVYFVAGWFINRLITMPTSLQGEAVASIPWIASLLPIALIGGIGGGALESRDRFLTANILQVIGSLVVQVVPVVFAVEVSPRLDVVVPAVVVTRYITAVMALFVALWHERPLCGKILDRSKARSLLNYGGWVGVTNIISPILTSIDQIVIVSYLGPSSVTHYSVPMSLAVRTQTLAAALSRTLFPRLSREGRAEAKELSEEATVTLANSYAVLCAPAIVLIHPFLSIWLGNDFATTAFPVAIILTVGAWINGLAFLPFALLQAQGRPDVPAKFHLTEFFPFICVLAILTGQFGLIGAGIAWTLRCSLDTVLLLIAVRFPLLKVIRLGMPFLMIVFAALFSFFSTGPFSIDVSVAVLFATVTAAIWLCNDSRLKQTILSFAKPT